MKGTWKTTAALVGYLAACKPVTDASLLVRPKIPTVDLSALSCDAFQLGPYSTPSDKEAKAIWDEAEEMSWGGAEAEIHLTKDQKYIVKKYKKVQADSPRGLVGASDDRAIEEAFAAQILREIGIHTPKTAVYRDSDSQKPGLIMEFIAGREVLPKDLHRRWGPDDQPLRADLIRTIAAIWGWELFINDFGNTNLRLAVHPKTGEEKLFVLDSDISLNWKPPFQDLYPSLRRLAKVIGHFLRGFATELQLIQLIGVDGLEQACRQSSDRYFTFKESDSCLYGVINHLTEASDKETKSTLMSFMRDVLGIERPARGPGERETPGHDERLLEFHEKLKKGYSLKVCSSQRDRQEAFGQGLMPLSFQEIFHFRMTPRSAKSPRPSIILPTP